MDLEAIFQIRTKKFWWMDVILYFSVSVFVAAIFCWLIFWAKNGIQQSQINDWKDKLQTVGTDAQKEQEKTVLDYQRKIDDFNKLFNNHQFASYAFAFMQAETMQNVWFKQFSLDRSSSQVQLTGESDDFDSLAHQVATFEQNKYVKNFGNLTSSKDASTAKVQFNFSLSLDSALFKDSSFAAALQPATSSEVSTQPAQPPVVLTQNNNQKMITSFNLMITPEITGLIDQTNYIITLNVPSGTKINSVSPQIVVSPGAVVSPSSGVVENFNNSVTYTVIASDNSVQAYKTVVNYLPATPKKPAKSSNESSWIIFSVLIFIVILSAGGISFLLWQRAQSNKNKEIDNI